MLLTRILFYSLVIANDPKPEWENGLVELDHVLQDNLNNYNCVNGTGDCIKIIGRPGFDKELLTHMLDKAKDTVIILELIGSSYSSEVEEDKNTR